ncbi:DNA mismatch repair ATPase msh1 [Bachmanniomyces sp. S44760]|nr:DNA mismatch repair ATPase msh1 [Bachmanniomyces sp. S44760]
MVKSGGLLFDRKVTRVVTPGTLVDEKFMNPYENNFLLAVHPVGDEAQASKETIDVLPQIQEKSILPKEVTQRVGLAWLDLSTGEFFTQAATLGGLPSAITRIGAKEIVLHESIPEDLRNVISVILQQQHQLVTWQPGNRPDLLLSQWTPMLESAVPEQEQADFTSEEIIAGSILLDFVKEKLQGLGIKLQSPIRRQGFESMSIDKNSMRGLEILDTARDGVVAGKGSLLHTIKRTVTKSGSRLLRDRLTSPSTSLNVIRLRQDLVDHFLSNKDFRERIIHYLRQTFDSQRLVQKFSLGRGDADDLVSLCRTIEATVNVSTILRSDAELENNGLKGDVIINDALGLLAKRLSMKGPKALSARIANAIDEDGLMATHQHEQEDSAEMVEMAQGVLHREGSIEDLEALSQIARSKVGTKRAKEVEVDGEDTWIMRTTASPALQSLHDTLNELRLDKVRLTSALREQASTPSLTLRWTPGLGHICHLKGVKDVRVSSEAFGSARNVSSSKSTRSFYLPEWSKLGGKIDQVKFQIKAEEQRVFQELREQVILNLVKLRRNAGVLDELDLACSFAILAEEQGFVRPDLNTGTSHKVVGGRHPTVTLGLEEQGRAFVSNDCFVGDQERIWLITGPNMAGKSTFLRQNALLSILAQIGSFVPAEHAEIGIVDQIFSRIGSADNLFQDQSTFMVEMLETATILKQATPRSFVIMDEVGRGTTPEDGVAVAFACLHHLYHTNQCRTLFATHFHDLADMTSAWPQLSCYCTDVAEDPNGSFLYVHRLAKGVNRQSHALKVAHLAGIPEPAIEVARGVIQSFRDRQVDDQELAPRAARAG